MPEIVLSIPPYIHNKHSTSWMMRGVLWATLPALITYTLRFGFSTLAHVTICIASALLFEASCLKIQKKPILYSLKDSSACVTAILLALTIFPFASPFAPLWLGIVGTFCAIVVAKHSYGGLGQNLFNPAMVGAVVLFIFFPENWAFSPESQVLMPEQQKFSPEKIAHDLQVNSEALYWSTSIAWLLGGLFLIYKKIIGWIIPCALLVSLGLSASLGYFLKLSTETPLVHLLFNTTLLGAFFIATDPVTSARGTKGKWIYGVLLGVLIYIIRLLHTVPEALPFAVLIANAMVPTLDALTQPPRTIN